LFTKQPVNRLSTFQFHTFQMETQTGIYFRIRLGGNYVWEKFRTPSRGQRGGV